MSKYTPENIITDVCNFFALKEEEVLTKHRHRELSSTRQICVYFIHKYFKRLSLKKVAGFIKSDRHSIVLYSVKVVNELMATDTRYKSEIEELTLLINSKL